MSTLLPLYHPFGPLALSLPDLDPTTFGLPAPHVMTGGLRINGIFDDPDVASHLRSSNRARRLAVKLRDATEDTTRASVPAGASPALVDLPPVAESEPSVRDKQSPRKRRYGGGGNKRKRRDVDDGDATYPAKRIRNPRSSALASSVPIAGTTPSPDEANASPPAEDGGNEKSRPYGRRSKRARGQAVRRDSTASEATVTSVSVSLAATGAVGNASENMEIEEPISAPTSKSSNSNVADEAGAPSVTASAERSSQEGDSEEPLETKES